jgi:copper chaperone CopZ
LIIHNQPMMRFNRPASFRIILFLFLLPTKSLAGYYWVEVGVNGLTCSVCTQSVERSIRRLDFVDSVSMSLEKTEGRIFLKRDAVVDLRKIAKAVVAAGFSVRFLRVAFGFDDMAIGRDGSFVYQGQPFQWLQFQNNATKGETILKLVDEGFLPKKESTIWKKKMETLNNPVDQKIFHVVQEQ